MDAAVLLIDPKYPHNVGAALRACALLGAPNLYWTGSRVPSPDEWSAGARLPREERMRCYRRTTLRHLDGEIIALGRAAVPVCVEIGMGESLPEFEHPDRAVYVFGPEDGGVPKVVRAQCHRFVTIPNALPDGAPDARTPFNLAAAVNIVLYDRLVKLGAPGSFHALPMSVAQR